jgi:hypothetical protein
MGHGKRHDIHMADMAETAVHTRPLSEFRHGIGAYIVPKE